MGTLLLLTRIGRAWNLRALLVLAVVIGVAGGTVMAGVAAVRRTESAFDRLIADTEAWDVLVNPDEGVDSALRFEDVAALPEVEQAGRLDGVSIAPPRVRAIEDLESGPVMVVTDGVWGYDFYRPRLVDGRLPDPQDPHEVLASPGSGLAVGDVVEGRALSGEDFARAEAAPSIEAAIEELDAPNGAAVELDVVGVGSFFDNVVVDQGFEFDPVVTTPAFFDRYQASAGWWGAVVRLREGAEVADVRAAVSELAPGEAFAFQTQAALIDQYDRAARPQVLALAAFTAVAGLIALVLVGQTISRRLQTDAVVLEQFRALGLSRRQRAAVGLLRVMAAAVLGALCGVAVAAALSGLAPTGIARRAEPDPGVQLDVAFLASGAVLVLLVVFLLAAPAAWRAVRRPSPRTRPSPIATRLAGSGLPVPAVTGTRFAVEPGPGRLPTRSTLVGAATSVTLVVATLVFSASLDHFVGSPELYGTSWDALVAIDGAEEGGAGVWRDLADQLEAEPGVEALSAVLPGQLELDGTPVPAVAFVDGSRPLEPTVIEGRAPDDPSEVALGTSTLRRLDVELGDEVEVRGEGEVGRLTVVGRTVLPAIGAYSGADKTTLGEGALVARATLHRFGPEFGPAGLAVAVADGVDLDDLAAAMTVPPTMAVVVETVPVPSDVTSLDAVRTTPIALSAALVALIVLTVIHALAASVRARRRELAVLRTIGFTGRQVRATVATQAMTIAAVGLVVGVPVGMVIGRLSWRAIIERLGAVPELVTPVALIGLTAAAVLGLALLAGQGPGRRAARARPATILRTE